MKSHASNDIASTPYKNRRKTTFFCYCSLKVKDISSGCEGPPHPPVDSEHQCK